MTNEQKQAFTLRIAEAGEAGLTVVLYDIILEYLVEAQKSFEEGDRNLFRRNIHSAQDAIRVQQRAIQSGYTISDTLFLLYNFFHAHLAKAIVYNSIDYIAEIRTMLQKLRDAYIKVEESDPELPIMENTQKVYAGLTYGKYSLNENIDTAGNDRGYLV